MSKIVYAGYGVYNETNNCTQNVQQLYNGGQRTFLADNNIGGGDPAPGQRKYLYIVWDQGTVPLSGVTGEGDSNGINVP